ncbi:MAG: alpha/beta hydrolase family protein [Candidatus Xenobia bacterium]
MPILATPRFAPRALALPPRALLVQNAGRDENVPPEASRQLVDSLRSHYREPERLCYREYPESAHFMRESDWNELWASTIAWFERWIS